MRVTKAIYFISVLFASLILAGAFRLNLVYSASRVPGVSVGQFFHYRITSTLSGNDTQLISAGNMTSGEGMFNITVTRVIGRNVTFYLVIYEDTQLIGTRTIDLDVDSGYANNSITQGFLFVGANLSVNDPVYTSIGYSSLRIGSTIQTDYLGAMRDTNYLHAENHYTNTNFFGIIANQTIEYDFYWDKSTGIETRLVNNVYYNRSDGSGNILTLHQKIELIVLSANPAIPEFSLMLILTTLIAITLLAIVIHRKSAVNAGHRTLPCSSLGRDGQRQYCDSGVYVRLSFDSRILAQL